MCVGHAVLFFGGRVTNITQQRSINTSAATARTRLQVCNFHTAKSTTDLSPGAAVGPEAAPLDTKNNMFQALRTYTHMFPALRTHTHMFHALGTYTHMFQAALD